MPPAKRLVLGRPLDPVLDLGGQRGRYGLGHSAPTLPSVDPQQRAAAQVSSSSQLTLAAAPMQTTDGPSTSAVPTAAANPAFATDPLLDDTPMLSAVPLSVPPDFLETAVSSAMCSWAEDVDIPVDIARQAILYVHAKFASERSRHPSADCTCLSKLLQALMVTAVRAVTVDASFHLLYGSDAQSDSPGAAPATDSTVADSPSMPTNQQQQLRQPPNGQAGSTNQPQSTRKCPLQPLGGLNEPTQTSVSTASVSQCQWARERQKRAALFAVLQAGPWHVIALQETHHATQAESAQWCREGAGPTAPWGGPSF